MISSRLNLPRWLIFLIDLLICAASVVLAYMLRFNFELPEKDANALPKVLIFVVAIRAVSFFIARTYAGIILYTSTKDAVRIVTVTTVGSIIFVLTDLTTFFLINGINFIPYSIIIIDFITTTLALSAFRILVKITYMEMNNPSSKKTNVLIYGAGESGLISKRSLDRDAGTKYKVLGFIDDDPKKIGLKIEDVPIYGPDKLEKLLENNAIEHLIISIQNIKPAKKQEIIETCLTYNTKVLNVPPVSKWINGELSFKQIKKINIEDLLERDEIRLDENKVQKELLDRCILVTGAAGSIGSEIVRQLARFSPKQIILIDQAESPLYHLELELNEKFPNVNFEIIICDVNHKVRMRKIMEAFLPQIIYHAAAYKHVPMMENNPVEAVFTNVLGTRIIADLAIEFKTEKFVMVSTDKAVNPTSVMGATKRIAEIYTQSLNSKNSTRFITTRFGNVLGSNGSVIPLFREQIEKGGPVTITHAEVTRYFMTIPEACQLVLEAGAMGEGGEIYIFDMGKSVKILDLAKKMIKLSRLELGKDIQIKYTGLRPGEKLYEELLNDKENTLPTYHPQIMIARVSESDYKTISNQLDELEKLLYQHDNMQIVKKMKEIVAEFKSQNSVYVKLD
ncbi:MAG: nucleoside-diphosphate sugar epimerase/dehydratase [Bacteroidales bacterium]|jgi:FlaA1/EpsC-like NDP-sugar epimerase|nr:polysaccharide biosynthesis protein [Bacteroidales bacterium]MDD4213881.1 nucleoside-diphosphate sugar epimerase/dehydratase [Bacteroidales bacterium]